MAEAVPRVALLKRLLLRILQYSQEKNCVGISFNKVAGLDACNIIKKRLKNKCFFVNIAKFLRAVFSEAVVRKNFEKFIEKYLCWSPF